MLDEQARNYLWDLFRIKLLLNDDVKTGDLISSLYERALDLPVELELLLLSYWKGWDVNYLMAALKMSVLGYFFDVEKHVISVALLVRAKLLTESEAKDLLLMPGKNLMGFHPAIEDAIDVAWLINQDASAGFPNSREDGLLKSSLDDVLAAYPYCSQG